MNKVINQNPQENSIPENPIGVWPKVAVIILNWNGWQDTIQCLESVLRSDYPNYHVFVCDNGSTDGSVEKIRAWAAGKQIADRPSHSVLSRLVFPPVAKPVEYVECGPAGGTQMSDRLPQLILIQTGGNLGWSGGNNAGIQQALKMQCDYIWLLNNDTLVHERVLRTMVQKAEENTRLGAVGSVLFKMTQPDCVQVWGGGQVNFFTGRSRFMTRPGPLDYITGGSLLLRRKAVEEVGLLDERFFLYWDDVDYSLRLRRMGWDLDAVEGAPVWHKEGGATKRNLESMDEHSSRSAVRFFRKHARVPWVPILIGIGGKLANRLVTGQWRRAWTVWKALQHGDKVIL